MNLETVGEWKSLEGLKSLKWKQVPAPDAPAEAPLVPLPILFAWRMARSSRRELEWAWHGKLIGAKIQVLAHWLETGRARCKGRGRTRATCAVPTAVNCVVLAFSFLSISHPHLDISTRHLTQLHQSRLAWGLADHAPCLHPHRQPFSQFATHRSAM